MATRGLGKGPKSAPKKKVVAAKPAAKKTAAKTASSQLSMESKSFLDTTTDLMPLSAALSRA